MHDRCGAHHVLRDLKDKTLYRSYEVCERPLGHIGRHRFDDNYWDDDETSIGEWVFNNNYIVSIKFYEGRKEIVLDYNDPKERAVIEDFCREQGVNLLLIRVGFTYPILNSDYEMLARPED